MDLRANLQRIQEGKAKEWLVEENKRWRCPKCGNPITSPTVSRIAIGVETSYENREARNTRIFGTFAELGSGHAAPLSL